ncbi:MAG: NAD(P)/FAD-dependent oxidoreductase, partial [Candidatus Rokuibacteriota bacterium]
LVRVDRVADAEILVIGGGIAGVAAAFHLRQHGHDVLVLERDEIASAASGINAGSIDSLGWGSAPDLQAHLTEGSREIFTRLEHDLGYDIELRHSGSLQAIHTEEQHEFARARVARLSAQGYRLQLLTTGEARGLEPGLNPELPGFIYSPQRAQADPRKATRALASAAERNGARVLTHHPVTAIRSRGDAGYLVTTARGDFGAGTLVVAAGAWCAPIGVMLRLRIPVVPVRGQMWATDPLPPRVFHTISSAESGCFWQRHPGHDAETPPELTHRGHTRLTRHLYGRQTRRGDMIFGGDRQLVGYDTTADPVGIEVNREHAAQVLPFLERLRVSRTWAGLMPFSLDGKPIIGRIPQRENVFIVSGLASSGFGRGPMAGKLLAECIHTGRCPTVLEAADPARCVTESASVIA